MNFYDVLAAEKWDGGIPTINFFDLLFAQSMGGEQWQTYEGTLPATINAAGSDLRQYQIYGATGGVGDRTVQLFDKDADDTDNGYVNSAALREDGRVQYDAGWISFFISEYIAILPNKSYILKNAAGNNAAFCIYDSNKTYIWGQKYANISTINFNSGDGAYFIRLTISKTQNKDTLMLTEGATPPENYVPYGYEVDISTSDGTSATVTPIYIGNDPLGKDEYVDYEAGKVYRKKAVHEDTVTINGIVWDILGYDCDTAYKDDNTLAQHTVTIQTHDCINELQFDAREALFAFPEGLAAGVYHFTIVAQPWYSGDIGKTITFTLASAIPAGGQLVVNNNYNATMIGSTISSYAINSATTAIETVTMSEGGDGIDLGWVDESLSQDGNTNGIQRALLGSNNWSQSAIRQYLNSSAAAGSVWTPQTKFDRPPSWAVNTAGFLRNADHEFISVLGNTVKITGLNTVIDGGGSETTFEKVFLLSRSEVYGGNEVSGGEGAPYPYYADYSSLSAAETGSDGNRIKYYNRAAKVWWLRSPRVAGVSFVRVVLTSGAIDNRNVAGIQSVAPACVIILDDIATNSWLQEKFLKPTDPPVPLPALPTYEGATIVDYAGESQATPEKVLLKYRKEGTKWANY